MLEERIKRLVLASPHHCFLSFILYMCYYISLSISNQINFLFSVVLSFQSNSQINETSPQSSCRQEEFLHLSPI